MFYEFASRTRTVLLKGKVDNFVLVPWSMPKVIDALCIVKISPSVNKKSDIGSQNDEGHGAQLNGTSFLSIMFANKNDAPLFGELPLTY
jgi:hypothetical protein